MCHFLRPAQRVGRLQPRAEAAGRYPGFTGANSRRPERPREASGPHVSRALAAFQAARSWRPLTQGIGLRPQPWARVSRPVGPATGIVRRFNERFDASPCGRPSGASVVRRPSEPSSILSLREHSKHFGCNINQRSPLLRRLRPPLEAPLRK